MRYDLLSVRCVADAWRSNFARRGEWVSWLKAYNWFALGSGRSVLCYGRILGAWRFWWDLKGVVSGRSLCGYYLG